MLDFKLIEQSTDYSKKQLLEKKNTVTPDLYFLDNFLHPEIIQKINNFVVTNELDWKTVAKQENLNRRQITFISDTVVEEIHMTVIF